ncbi:hypothetical protein [Micromonospora sp. NBC_00858]|uniref:hypothetical protein n=1 Tax=Micromonospora sp. NBC_00858 TaxID=2975979 RepID=UPI003870B44A|nr:hypothetical protein OG990_07825 [Micromonospora sp. NBC_00858]
MTNLTFRETSLPRRRPLRAAVAAVAVFCTVMVQPDGTGPDVRAADTSEVLS